MKNDKRVKTVKNLACYQMVREKKICSFLSFLYFVAVSIIDLYAALTDFIWQLKDIQIKLKCNVYYLELELENLSLNTTINNEILRASLFGAKLLNKILN